MLNVLSIIALFIYFLKSLIKYLFIAYTWERGKTISRNTLTALINQKFGVD